MHALTRNVIMDFHCDDGVFTVDERGGVRASQLRDYNRGSVRFVQQNRKEGW
jgi:hypothetical protein